MCQRYSLVIYIFICSVLFCCNPALGISANELSDICQSMELAISDISIEYEWLIIPPYTAEETDINNLIVSGAIGFINENGIERKKLEVIRPGKNWSRFNSKDPNMPLNYPFLFEESHNLTNLQTQKNQSVVSNSSYNSNVFKKLQRDDVILNDGSVNSIITGLISERGYMLWEHTPLAFSVLRLCLIPIWDYKPLSVILRDSGDFVLLDDKIIKINDFNTIRANFLDPCEPTRNRVYLRVYFSIDHNYTPVKYEHMTGSVNKPEHIGLSIEVQSLEKIGPNLWFPSSGLLINPNDNLHSSGFRTVGPILANQGLSPQNFDIKFPLGTKVQDNITNREYVFGTDSR